MPKACGLPRRVPQRSSPTWAIAIAGALAAAAPAPIGAQGTRADYERAAKLGELTRDKVFRDRVDPHWLADGSRFWYRNDLRGGEREFILVDAAAGARGPAFDHAKVAEALQKALGREVSPTRLPIERIEPDAEGKALGLQVEGKRWTCDLATWEVREAATAASTDSPARLRDLPRSSRRTGGETWLTFVNRTKGDVRTFWLDFEGEKQPYATVRPGEEHRQHTFGGHVWVVTDPAGKPIAAFEAQDDPTTAVVDGEGTLGLEPRAERRRRPRGGDGFRSPDAKWTASFRDDNLFVRRNPEQRGEGAEAPRDDRPGEDGGEAGGAAETRLSADGKPGDSYGGPVWWSPDSTRVVAMRTEKGDERKVYYVESSPRDQLQPKLHSYDYLKPGDKVPHPRPQLFDVPAGKQIPLGDALWPNPWSIDDVRWDPDSRRFLFLYNERGHQLLRVVAVDAATGEARSVIDERSATFVDYAHKTFRHHLDATREILWMSERDGWNHLWLLDADSGAAKCQVTRGEWVVRGVERVDEETRQVWFRASGIRPGQDPYHIHHCRVNLDGTGLTILTEGDGTHSVRHSPDGRYLIDSWSRVDQPPVNELRRTVDGSLVCELERADWTELLATGWKAPERFVAKGRDGATDIHGIIHRPTSFDPARKYPVIEEIYAGPQDSHVPKAFRTGYLAQSIAELGFIVVQIDGMGTSNRSKKFHDVCWRNLGDAGFPDRIPWIRAAAERYPYMDISRVGIYGGSAGGQNALGALLFHGDFYKVAVADCGCHDNRMDKIWWNELWMGWPVGPWYEAASNVANAHRLQGKLLLVVGEMDENVDPASTMQVASALVRADKDFDLLVVPGRGHGSAESPYGRRRRADFFVRHLLGVEPRRE